MATDLVIAKIDAARTMLAEAKTIQDTKKVVDIAVAAEIYARRQQLGEEAIIYATAIKVEALAQLGRMLKETPRNPGIRLAGRDIGGAKTAPPSNIPTLTSLGLDKKTSKLAQDIAKLPEEEIEKVKAGVISLHKLQKQAHVSYNTGGSEWYTPPEYIEAARKVMGSIDTDPASSEIANKIINATTYYTAKNDGRLQPWRGNVWLNPPYTQPLASDFCNLLVKKYKDGEIQQACVLVNNATDTVFFQDMLQVCSAICFIKGRVKFLSKEGEPGSPLQGQAAIYLGKDYQKFIEAFCQFGATLYGNSQGEDSYPG